LRSKRSWVAENNDTWRHSLLVPDAAGPGHHALHAPRLPFSHGYRFPLNRRAAAHAIVGLMPDIIEAGDPYRLAWSALDAGWRLGIPVVAFCHSNPVELATRFGGTAAGRLARIYLRRLYRQFDAVFASSAWMVGELRALGLDNVMHQPLGVDCAVFHPRRAQAGWRTRLGLGDDDFVLLYAGRFAAEKNLHVLVEATQRLGRHTTLVLIGDGPQVPSGARVIRLPYQPDAEALATALASADLFVHAGDQETFGLAALEALACGTPVVARARAGLRDLVDGQTVFGVAGGSAERFAEVIAPLRQAARQIRDAARVRALQFDHRIAFARQFERYAALRTATTFGETAPEGADHAT
jgi:alpha-1,6-mannosyltransferase